MIAGLNIDLTKDISDEIPARAFRTLADTEARIACKIDSSVALPRVLSSKRLFPLPVRNGAYVLVRGKGFHEFEQISGSPGVYESKVEFDLATTSGIGESIFVHYAYNSGLLSKFTGIDNLLKTNEGRFYAKDFSFMVGKVGPIFQSSTQIQVDGLFESKDCVIIVEAKTKDLPDFIIRQLYYPYRHWSLDSKKDVDTIFLGVDIDSGVYSFWQYHFTVPGDYSSIEIVRKYKYRIVERPRSEKDLDKITSDTRAKYVPQADSVERILRIPFLISAGIREADALAKEMRFTNRQASYYSEATEALGLIERRRVDGLAYRFALTSLGEEFVASRPDERNRILAEQMISLPTMRLVFDSLMDLSFSSSAARKSLSVDSIAELIRKESYLTGSTPRRRATTIISWFQWIGENYGVMEVKNKSLSFRGRTQTKLSV